MVVTVSIGNQIVEGMEREGSERGKERVTRDARSPREVGTDAAIDLRPVAGKNPTGRSTP